MLNQGVQTVLWGILEVIIERRDPLSWGGRENL